MQAALARALAGAGTPGGPQSLAGALWRAAQAVGGGGACSNGSGAPSTSAPAAADGAGAWRQPLRQQEQLWPHHARCFGSASAAAAAAGDAAPAPPLDRYTPPPGTPRALPPEKHVSLKARLAMLRKKGPRARPPASEEELVLRTRVLLEVLAGVPASPTSHELYALIRETRPEAGINARHQFKKIVARAKAAGWMSAHPSELKGRGFVFSIREKGRAQLLAPPQEARMARLAKERAAAMQGKERAAPMQGKERAAAAPPAPPQP